MKVFLLFFVIFTSNSITFITSQIYHCSGTVIIDSQNQSSLSGVFQSQLNADAYLDLEICDWIFIGDPNQMIKFSFTIFGLETNFDFLSIYEGASQSPSYQLSGYVLPENITLSLPCTVAFTSDELITGPGFAINYFIGSCINKCSGNGDCINGNCICYGGWMGPVCNISYCPNNCSPYGVCINGSFCQCEVGYYGGDCLKETCDKFTLLTATSGTFRDQNINRDYAPSTSCTWLISLPSSVATIHLSFLRLQIYDLDYVTINGNSIFKLFTNAIASPNLISILNSNVLVQFTTNEIYERSGFEISYTTEFCPLGCSGNGVCDNGTCLCFLGWNGIACNQIDACPNNCSGNGICINLTCICNSNTFGPDCSGLLGFDFNCSSTSLTNSSNLISINTFCQYPIIVQNASSYLVRVLSIDLNMTIFIYANFYELYATYTYDNFSSPIIVYSSSIFITGNGAGNATIQYQTFFCPNSCSNNGFCYLGRCICNFGFEGTICDQNVCPNNCSNNGICESGICKCNVGFYGIDCSSTFCSGTTIINQSSGIIADHDHRKSYTQYLPNSYCQWIITNPNGNPFGFAFQVFQTDQFNDLVNIYDGNTTSSHLIVSSSGSWSPSPIQSSGPFLLVLFQSDSFFQFRGFIASFTDITFCPNSCSNNGVCNQGVCNCNPSKTGKDCSQNIVATAITMGETITVQLNDWEWKQYYIVSNFVVSYLTFQFKLLSSNGDPEFYFNTNQEILAFNTTFFPYYESPYVIPYALIQTFWIGIYSRHIESSVGSVVSLSVFGCVNSCNGGGYCFSGSCVCDSASGFYGEYCQYSNCTPPCKNGGVCVGFNLCDCSGTFFPPPTCDTTCNPPCQNGGVCIVTGYEMTDLECNCTGTGYFGVTCEKALCQQSCGNGECIGLNQCSCSGSECFLSSTPTISSGVLISILVILSVTIVCLGFLIVYMLFIKKTVQPHSMGLAGMDELHDM